MTPSQVSSVSRAAGRAGPRRSAPLGSVRTHAGHVRALRMALDLNSRCQDPHAGNVARVGFGGLFYSWL